MNSKKTREIGELSTGGYPQPDALALPHYVCPQAWAAFVEMRSERRNPLTARAARLVIKRLMAMHAEGYCPTAALEKSVRCCWLDVYPGERLAQPDAPVQAVDQVPAPVQAVPAPDGVTRRLAELRADLVGRSWVGPAR